MADYNGWTNYETWNVALWMDNEQSSYNYWRETAAETWNEATANGVRTRSEDARYTLADRLKAEFEEANPMADQASMWSDLMSAALSEVNWDEIANNLLEDMDGNIAEEPAYESHRRLAE